MVDDLKEIKNTLLRIAAALETAQRPYMDFSLSASWADASDSLAVSVEFTNYGQMPARLLDVSIGMIVGAALPSNRPPLSPCEADFAYDSLLHRGAPMQVTPPDTRLTFSDTAMREAFTRGECSAWVYGTLRFRNFLPYDNASADWNYCRAVHADNSGALCVTHKGIPQHWTVR